jgi:hypothetical protein
MKTSQTTHLQFRARGWSLLEESDISILEERTNDIPQVNERENEILTSPFMMEEIKETMFQMEHNKAPSLDGFPIEFYQIFWEVIKKDLMTLFINFFEEHLLLYNLTPKDS